MSKECSKEFVEAMGSQTAKAVRCICGRLHFVNADIHSSPQVLDQFQFWERYGASFVLSHNLPPGRLISSISSGDTNIVWDCPCTIAKKFEELIWDQRQQIIQYLAARSRHADTHFGVSPVSELEALRQALTPPAASHSAAKTDISVDELDKDHDKP